MAAPGVPTISVIHPKPKKNILLWSDVANATIYNLYWIKAASKIPNCYFTSLNDWVVTKEDGSETAEIVSGEYHLDIPDGITAIVDSVYSFLLPQDDFIITLDITDYNYDNPDYGPMGRIMIRPEGDNTVDGAHLRFRHSTGTFFVDSHYKVDGIVYEKDQDNIANYPTKLRWVRTGTTMEAWYYDSSWTKLSEYDFSSRINNLNEIILRFRDTLSNGGSMTIDNLIATPTVKDSGTKISDIISPYDHIGLDAGCVHIYELTAENNDGESSASLESFETPAVDQPQKMGLLNDTGAYPFNTYSIDFYYEQHQEVDFNNDPHIRSTNLTLKTYNLGSKKRHLLTFKNMSNSDRGTLLTLWTLREHLYFYFKSNGAGLKVRWVGDLNLMPTNKSKQLYLLIWEGSILLEEI